MSDNEYGFILAGGPEFMIGGGGKGGIQDDKSQQEEEALPRLAVLMQESQTDAAEKEFTETLNGFLQDAGMEALSPEKAVELMFYATEHQADRWAELFDFFVSEAAALFAEAMEAVNGES